MKKRRLIAGTSLAVLLIFVLYKQIDLETLRNFRVKIDFYLLIAALSLYILANIVRAQRFNYIMNNCLKLIDMFKITAFYNLYTGIFPGGIGELSFIFLVRKKIKKYVPSALSSIITTRIFDILVTSVYFLCSLIILGRLKSELEKYIFVVIVIILFLMLHLYIDKIMMILSKMLSVLTQRYVAWLKSVADNFRHTSENLEDNKNKSFLLFIFTFPYWGVNFFIIQLTFWSIGLEISYFESVFLGAISNLTSTIPINTIGGFGYKEAGLTLGLIFIGVAKSDAVIFSFLVHLLHISFMFMLALISKIASAKFSNAIEAT